MAEKMLKKTQEKAKPKKVLDIRELDKPEFLAAYLRDPEVLGIFVPRSRDVDDKNVMWCRTERESTELYIKCGWRNPIRFLFTTENIVSDTLCPIDIEEDEMPVPQSA